MGMSQLNSQKVAGEDFVWVWRDLISSELYVDP